MKKLVFMFLLFVGCLFGESLEKKGPLGVTYGDPTVMKKEYIPSPDYNYGVNHAKKGNYQVFVAKLGKIDIRSAKAEEIFYGKSSDYEDVAGNTVTESSVDGMLGTLNVNPETLLGNSGDIAGAVGSGLGIGLVWGLIGQGIHSLKKDIEYTKVVLYTDKNGNKGKVTSLFVCDTNEYNEAEIRNLMLKKEKEIL